tara:strand:- start:878 stop:1300 length:423 start_codon:yes stop_codon:yes gene_type:complete
MIIPVRCFSCNNEIGDKYELYKTLKEEVQKYEDRQKPNELKELKELTKIYNIIKVSTEADNYLSEYKTGQIKELIKKFKGNVNEQLENLTDVIISIKGHGDEFQKKVEFLNMLVFILLDIENYCCNRHLISHIELIDKIN